MGKTGGLLLEKEGTGDWDLILPVKHAIHERKFNPWHYVAPEYCGLRFTPTSSNTTTYDKHHHKK